MKYLTTTLFFLLCCCVLCSCKDETPQVRPSTHKGILVEMTKEKIDASNKMAADQEELQNQRTKTFDDLEAEEGN